MILNGEHCCNNSRGRVVSLTHRPLGCKEGFPGTCWIGWLGPETGGLNAVKEEFLPLE